MPYVTVGKENGTDIDIYYKDWGKGQPIMFSHGWPLSGDDWDPQMLFFLSKGYRVIAHDRRGHGRSTQVADGHDLDHYADDLKAVTDHLNNSVESSRFVAALAPSVGSRRRASGGTIIS